MRKCKRVKSGRRAIHGCLAAVIGWFLLGTGVAQATAVMDGVKAADNESKRPETVNVPRPSLPLAGKVIIVDAGHGGPDGGASGLQKTAEKGITLAIARDLRDYLVGGGATVRMTRQTDRDLASEADRAHHQRHLGDLRGRLAVVRRTSIDAFVSIHCNTAPSASWQGAQVIYLGGNECGKELAKALQTNLRTYLLPTHRDIQPNRTLFLLKRIPEPAALAEVGFLTNPEEAAALRSPSYQHRVAFALYAGLIAYFIEHRNSNASTVGDHAANLPWKDE